MEKNLSITLLIDFYGQLLTPKQLEALEAYYNEDLSLSEIATQMDISRQGVRDFIKRGEKQLLEYENTLALAGRFEHIKTKIEKINDIADSIELKQENRKMLDELKSITKQVLEQL